MVTTVADSPDAGSVTVLRDGPLLRLTLARPDRRNALSPPMTATLVEALTAAASDDTLRAIHVRGSGDDFCAGSDWVAANAGDRRPRTGDLVRRIPQAAHRVIELLHTIALPVVCSVRGRAVGLGCNLALAADFTIAATDAVFWEPFLARGFSPDSGSTWLLPRLVGLARARRMLLLGEKVDGARAEEWGLIHQAVPPAEVDSATEELLARLADGPTVAIGLTKQALHYGQAATLPQAMTQELFNLELSCRTADFKEGLAAFGQRRPPEFTGR
ncbi:enoyl-CoA hydratase/isomerase family protein [[Mycobacterium] crassicus]|uniref:Enoyl-CoA hydratase-related protein n=1 Tax=[Mycobacterium] crassicus TaxID=2872309 RepID=A0ABU5XCU8_9MYCO|nr:enoyl-CoA hydratase-related protein [Mycolicibacter sp. MYC098]MEB3019623.1 enoyl-CoA hydratase-related protein [Mycolicibacter sp. MYC098]